MSKRRQQAPGTSGYAEEQPRQNDERELPDEHTVREPQNSPQRPMKDPKPSGSERNK